MKVWLGAGLPAGSGSVSGIRWPLKTALPAITIILSFCKRQPN